MLSKGKVHQTVGGDPISMEYVNIMISLTTLTNWMDFLLHVHTCMHVNNTCEIFPMKQVSPSNCKTESNV